MKVTRSGVNEGSGIDITPMTRKLVQQWTARRR